MKKLIFLIAASFSGPLLGYSQEQSITTYWVVETNKLEHNHSIVRFYDKSDSLLHEVKVTGIHIDISNSVHKKYLNMILNDFNNRKYFTGLDGKAKNMKRFKSQKP